MKSQTDSQIINPSASILDNISPVYSSEFADCKISMDSLSQQNYNTAWQKHVHSMSHSDLSVTFGSQISSCHFNDVQITHDMKKNES